jgi:hypothetical protein
MQLSRFGEARVYFQDSPLGNLEAISYGLLFADKIVSERERRVSSHRAKVQEVSEMRCGDQYYYVS